MNEFNVIEQGLYSTMIRFLFKKPIILFLPSKMMSLYHDDVGEIIELKQITVIFIKRLEYVEFLFPLEKVEAHIVRFYSICQTSNTLTSTCSILE
ncbi:hypothetical protein BLOT_002728 [Blomia tropicalis]|nr:hypothetical protein BLOT_002728 [Blomia tropicalis]